MAHSTGSDDSSCQGFSLTQQEISMASYEYNSSDNQFLYFSYLHDEDHHEYDDDEQTAYKRALKEFSQLPPPLGLKITMTPEMLQSTRTSQVAANNKVEKLKAVQFPMNMLKIGYFKIEAKYPYELVAKCYYARQKLMWEILHDGLKYKIEIHCQNISAIRAVIEENSHGILEIELDKVPSFFREIDPKPKKHTMWTISHDFTDGQASEYRRHYLQFPPGVLDQHYMKLLQSNNRLLELSRKTFPSSYSAYFNSHIDQGTTQFSFGHDLHAIACPYSLML
ncbi:hypothetical protein AAZX31_20G087300 [Glycine max]|uniref:TRF2/HOY1 PH-like domain-containing protein n=2 Tax=Glycine subgen. Soja TaxID=1462606 RepID=K7N2L5_SOYBN|nr:uncharacterized protein LOC102661114 [Glycine max]XP_028221370.1 uncharacterized protein LOC114402886 [Glycine soja]KAG4907319.1 hypothetical protein JHK86_055803 [Glycine max]KAH1035388.1 hypothetical protein GYH30_055385 [Glycine max]KAH1190398.1 hypothetical protein GmHk_20G057955 [Glycine max]KRG90540.1 hypothetical protein GLYMA_20G097800v4 [Glycine max]RZB43162.1 hypothetical protein D0Y65_053661 [Glycine soja]|eukprot:XP_006605820.1 uncharacterized protein LOC102661114 [Glycine max]